METKPPDRILGFAELCLKRETERERERESAEWPVK